MEHLPLDRDSAVRLAYSRGQLEAPVLALREYVRMLRTPAPDSPLIPDFEKLNRLTNELHASVRHILDAPTVETDPSVLRVLRHDLRGQAGRIVTLCDLLCEDEVDAIEPDTITELQTIREVAHRVIGQINTLMTTNPEHHTETTPDLERVLKNLSARQGRHVEPGRILLADDNIDNRELVTRLLVKHRGHTVTAVEDGEAALEALRTSVFDLVLLDVIMPGLNGFEVLERILDDPDWRHIPVIMMSALGDEEAVITGLLSGAVDYVRRPFEPALLFARIDASLDRKRLRDRELAYQEQIEKLFRALFPPEVVDEVCERGTIPPRRHDFVGVLFLDVVGFTAWCEAHKNQPEQVVDALQFLVTSLEEIARRHGVQKIKTIGDAFLGTTGLTRSDPDPVATLVRCGAEMMRGVATHPRGWQVRIGIHVGPVMAGIIGATQFQFDVFGDTVNRTARIQTHAQKGGIALSESAWEQVRDRFSATRRIEENVRGIGQLILWDLDVQAISREPEEPVDLEPDE